MAIFDEKIEIRERCKGVHCVDLGESFPTRIYLQKSKKELEKIGNSIFNREKMLTIFSRNFEIEERCKGPFLNLLFEEIANSNE